MRRGLFGGMTAAGLLLAGLFGASGASAATAGPAFTIQSHATPGVFSSEHNSPPPTLPHDSYSLVVTNSGKEPTAKGGTITVSDTLPAHLTALSIGGELQKNEALTGIHTGGAPQPMSCDLPTLTCTYGEQLLPGQSLVVTIFVSVALGVGALETNTATASGGGAATVSTSEATKIGSDAESVSEPYGFQSLTLGLTGVDGLLDTQAGAHPYETTFSFALNTIRGQVSLGASKYVPAGGLDGNLAASKDVVVDAPAGLLGNPSAVEKCPQFDVVAETCPPSTQVGVVKIYTGRFARTEIDPLYNVVPDQGFPAQFEFAVNAEPITVYATVVPQTNYAVRLTTPDIPELGGSTVGFSLTFFGTAATDHNYFNINTAASAGAKPPAFLQNPTGCSTQEQKLTAYTDSWQRPGQWLSASGVSNGFEGSGYQPLLESAGWTKKETLVFPQITGCELLQFSPTLKVEPDTSQADEPAGINVKLDLPQAPLFESELASPALKEATVTLPSGVSVSPSAADGLEGCAPSQIELESAGEGHCPKKSKIAKAIVTTPLLTEPLEGSVFLETPGCNPCSNADAAEGKMFRLYLEVAGSGVVIKKEGVIHANPTTGQLTTTFADLPQEPVSHIELQFNSGLRAALATPQACGSFTITSDLVPYSTPITPDGTPESEFPVDWNGNGGACPATMPFSPFFEAGTSNPNAGQASPLTVSFKREDREQDLAGVQVVMPPGLTGSLSGIPLCGEGEANLGTCSSSSQIGSMTVAAGPGGHPFYEKGRVYLTGSYRGTPFGLSVVVPTVAGPFNLGNVVVRATVSIDPHTTVLTVTSDPFPQIIDGVPLRLRLANVTVDRPGFIINPTNCAPQHIQATISGAQGAVAHDSVPFAVAGCAGLHFGPKFTVTSSGKTSRKNGASLDAKLVFPAGAQSNVSKVKVNLPKQLPSRLTTLQKACPDATFNANPASCPKGSLIGLVKAITPILPIPLTGPVYFVSHGGAQFPDLVAVMQGYGVRVDLVGNTFISKAGITSSTFKSVPDVPVSSFELRLPEGPHSALAANGNLCTSKLAMPTSFIAQDGAQIKQSTPIKVTGCPKAKKARRARRARSAGHRHNGQGRGK